MSELRFAIVGAGFWSQFQLAGWTEIPGVHCLAVCDSDLTKARMLAERFGISEISCDLSELLSKVKLDFVDIVTDVESHVPLAMLAIEHGVSAICQKPMAATWERAISLCNFARAKGKLLLVHENWRWQAPIRRLKKVLDAGSLGTLVRARIDYAHSFPVFESQPALRDLKQFILMDMGTHILDVSRYLFGEADCLYCQTRQMRTDIAGEDVATVMIRKRSGLTVTCNMSYSSKWEMDRFPQTMIAVEGTLGGVSLGADYALKWSDSRGLHTDWISIPKYSWAHPQYELVHASIVPCQRNLLSGLRGDSTAETSGDDNLRTLQLVFASYESAARNAMISIPPIS